MASGCFCFKLVYVWAITLSSEMGFKTAVLPLAEPKLSINLLSFASSLKGMTVCSTLNM